MESFTLIMARIKPNELVLQAENWQEKGQKVYRIGDVELKAKIQGKLVVNY